MTAVARKQEFLVDSLPEKRRKFVIAWVGEAAGNATKAATIAGYAAPAEEGSRLLRNALVLEAIEEMQLALGTDTESMIMGVTELRRFWTRVARGEESDVQVVRTKDGEEASKVAVPMVPRLKASELLGKSLAAFVERHKVEVVNGPTDETELRTRLEGMVAELGGRVVWDEQLTEGSDGDG